MKEGKQSIWDRQVKELFPDFKQQGDVQDLIDRLQKGPAMDGEDKDFKVWHKQMSTWWRTQRKAANKSSFQKLLPDGLIVEKDKRVIYILEGVRTDDDIGTIKIVSIKREVQTSNLNLSRCATDIKSRL